MVASQKTIYPETGRQPFLRTISWETYERLLAEKQEQPGARLYYNNGMLEESSQKDSIQWLQDVRGWIRSQLVSEQPR